MKIPTVKIKDTRNKGDYIVINEADFDESQHTLFEEKPRPRKKAAAKKKATSAKKPRNA